MSGNNVGRKQEENEGGVKMQGRRINSLRFAAYIDLHAYKFMPNKGEQREATGKLNTCS